MLRAALLAMCCAVFGTQAGCVFYLNPLCSDQIKNGDETGIDCGGPLCGKCEIGDGCRVDVDCEDSDCKGGKCTAFPCFNGVRDGDETDIDCGGGCRTCGGGRGCLVNDDCASGTCEATNTCSGLAVVSFTSSTYDAGDKPYVALTADLDGDGHADIVSADELNDEVYIFRGKGDGTFFAPSMVKTGAYPTGGAIADFNNDGLPDIVTADYHGDSVSVLRNNGGAAFLEKVTYPTRIPGETSNLAVGDLDGDGRVDVVATNPQTSSFSVLLGSTSPGPLSTAVDVPVGIAGASEPYSAAIGDYDKDGRPDVAIADSRSGTVVIRLGNGDGTFAAEQPFPLGGTAPYIILTHDLNGDGVLDLACANRGSDNVSVLIGRGDGTFRKPLVSSTGMMSGPYHLAVADFNNDGIPDLVTADYASTATFAGNDASILIGIGNGKFEPPIIVPGIPAYGVAPADYNHDGKIDFAAVNFTYKKMTVNLSTAH